MKPFSDKLLNWYHQNRRDLPWRHTRDPYRIMVSEIMLQQTRVDTVISYYHRFLERFPTAKSLADADEDDVLNLWKGLGYYSRARNLQKAAKVIITEHEGIFPENIAQVKKLPGVGDYTAGAIMSIAFNQPFPAVDGNVLRVITRIMGIDRDISLPGTKDEITQIVQDLIPVNHAGDFTQALMELGAVVCSPKSPACGICPVAENCIAYRQNKVDSLPVKKKKEKQQVTAFDALVFIDENKLLMTRTHPGSLLKNLWGIPLIAKEEERDLPANVLDRIGIEAHSFQPAGQIRHVFTHRIWEMDILLCSQFSVIAAKPDFHWISVSEIGDLPVPAAFSKILKQIGLWYTI